MSFADVWQSRDNRLISCQCHQRYMASPRCFSQLREIPSSSLSLQMWNSSRFSCNFVHFLVISSLKTPSCLLTEFSFPNLTVKAYLRNQTFRNLPRFLIDSSHVWYQRRHTVTGCVTSEGEWRTEEQKVLKNDLGLGRSCATGFLCALEMSWLVLFFSSLLIKQKISYCTCATKFGASI